ncbi:winged helix-turn-helix domain-containing protein [Solwaraspora sp. WMMD1047]|uniref:GntR family transcriptional regulator n=1 Tax=Solwaraspora sp. WMMD1047 TaxID=3016102 RepID=UPI002415E3BA|nr:winged helix-turn-helix domain-containing protein [Solwaraspora sp. WMMD1047]MDG4833666.1 winged helix-turn-helix domain-containing protein [Solwaraspora sp. WMMD1047]
MSTTRPSFRQIVDDYTEQIKSGELPPGTRLPSASQLANTYYVSLGTVSRALELLHHRELISAHPAHGRYVTYRTTA